MAHKSGKSAYPATPGHPGKKPAMPPRAPREGGRPMNRKAVRQKIAAIRATA